ncbi:Rieske (2Fe-2S) protein [Nocardioides jiangxiensis]|uniref:Cytochrome bc1 complex Rieske iron-sulfur subunit n=1 Tax=Nocardioides jiangxiensis TaxID=3064524 RepID=A0ABT9AX28_9ACTN|nr:Rieske (2Fe-2S) protein [Nocardioides sp. WY-20]MDO7867071.1 Rieske (2Fe-2S) protein [Nocardioides sp. WY-20]
MSAGNLSRRSVVAAVGAAPLLAACGAEAARQAAPAASVTPTPGATAHPSAGAGRGPAGAAPEGPSLLATSQVPVGGAVVVAAQSLVVTQPVAGEFRCFSSVCTHAGCTVRAGSPLVCPCHGSEFAIADGSVLRGPAATPLPERRIAVHDGEVRLA